MTQPPRPLAQDPAHLALDLVGDLPDRHAAVRADRHHAEPRELDRGEPKVVSKKVQLAPAQRAAFKPAADEKDHHAPLPQETRAALAQAFGAGISAEPAEWSADEVYLAMPRPGGDAWVRIDRESGAAEFEDTDRGWIAYFNDLHKGRNAGLVWSLFLDVFAAACLLFSITGLLILSSTRRSVPSPGRWSVLVLYCRRCWP